MIHRIRNGLAALLLGGVVLFTSCNSLKNLTFSSSSSSNPGLYLTAQVDSVDFFNPELAKEHNYNGSNLDSVPVRLYLSSLTDNSSSDPISPSHVAFDMSWQQYKDLGGILPRDRVSLALKEGFSLSNNPNETPHINISNPVVGNLYSTTAAYDSAGSF